MFLHYYAYIESNIWLTEKRAAIALVFVCLMDLNRLT